MKNCLPHTLWVIAVALVQSVTVQGADGVSGAKPTTPSRQMEHLGRGVVAVHLPDGRVFISWRLLGTDTKNVAFNLYRKSEPAPGCGGFGQRRFGGFPPSDEPVRLNERLRMPT